MALVNVAILVVALSVSAISSAVSVRRGEKAMDFHGFLGCVGVDDIGGRVGLVKPKSRGVVLVEVAVEWERVFHSNEKRSVYDFIRLFFVCIPLRYQKNHIAKCIPLILKTGY